MQIHNLISDYQDHAFLGPHSIEIGPFSSKIYLIQKIFTSQTQVLSNKHQSKAD